MKILKFDGFEVPVSDEELSQEVFNIDFGGHMMVQFTKKKDGTFEPTNAMDGWGDNCFHKIAQKEVVIVTQTPNPMKDKTKMSAEEFWIERHGSRDLSNTHIEINIRRLFEEMEEYASLKQSGWISVEDELKGKKPPSLIQANDTRVMVNGRPLPVPFRIVSEENYQILIKGKKLQPPNNKQG